MAAMAESRRPTSLGELKRSGYQRRSIRQEIHNNVVARLRSGQSLLRGIIGYERTVVPELENALLAGQSMVLLGERGQGKSRLIRSLVQFLDEYVPYISGTETHDDPLAPISAVGRSMVEEMGDETPVAWLQRNERYGEKLATPDVSMADLIGDVDPIKVAEGRYLGDELTIHYGLIPRTNRGILCVNELPDLAERIQVGLFNLMEEQDVQIRGYNIRLPLDIMVVATANPEDYTNRGRIITPLKDRFGAQIRTHYPLTTKHERSIVEQESVAFDDAGVRVIVPDFMAEIVAELSQQARRSSDVNQRSGVSVRLSISNYETLKSAALKRAITLTEDSAAPRMTDLPALSASMRGKIELETFEEGREDRVIEGLTRKSVLNVFKQIFPEGSLFELTSQFEAGQTVDTSATSKSDVYRRMIEDVPALSSVIDRLNCNGSDAEAASAIEFVLEGLHLSRELNRDVVSGGFRYLKQPPQEPAAGSLGGLEMSDAEREEMRRRIRQRNRRNRDEL
jgi:magnesium chelatase subunit I